MLKALNSYNFLHLSRTSLSFINYTSLIVLFFIGGIGKKKASEALSMDTKNVSKLPHEMDHSQI